MGFWEIVWAFLDSTFFQSVAVIVSVYVAYRGVNAWQDQHVWTRNAELAEELMVTARDFQHAMQRVRSPIGYAGEGASRERGQNESDDLKRHLDHLFTPIERLRNENDVLTRLQSADSRSRVRFGKEVCDCLDSLLEAYRECLTTARVRYLMGRDMFGHLLSNDEIEAKRKRDEVVWTIEGSDALGERIRSAVSGLETALGEYIGKKNR